MDRVEFPSSPANGRWLWDSDSPKSACNTNSWKPATGFRPNRDNGRANVTPWLPEAEDAVCLLDDRIQKATFFLEASDVALLETNNAGSSSQNSFHVGSPPECSSSEIERYFTDLQPLKQTERFDEHTDIFPRVSALERMMTCLR